MLNTHRNIEVYLKSQAEFGVGLMQQEACIHAAKGRWFVCSAGNCRNDHLGCRSSTGTGTGRNCFLSTFALHDGPVTRDPIYIY